MAHTQSARDDGVIVLERDIFRALASETRIQILLLLNERPMTVTGISKRLKIGKATAYEHLKKLMDSELVRRRETENIWVYYELTKKGQALFSKTSLVRLRIALAAIVSFDMVLIGRYMYALGRPTMGIPTMAPPILAIVLSVPLCLLCALILWVGRRSPMRRIKSSLFG